MPVVTLGGGSGRRIGRAPAGTAAGGGGLYPNEPVGYTRFAETDYTTLPWSGGMTDGGAYIDGGASNMTIVSGADLPVAPDGRTSALRYRYPAGTVAGYSPLGGGIFGMWDTSGDQSNTEYSEFYESTQFCIYGNGTYMETPLPGYKALGYWGSTNNNQSISGGGAVQWLNLFAPLDATADNPRRATQFSIYFSTQNGTNVNYFQNLNLSKVVELGVVHRLELVARLNDVGSANGELHWWLDGIKIGEHTDVEFINASFANQYGWGGDGLAGFFGRKFSLIWGGSGGANMSANMDQFFYHTYLSGVFLRAANP